MTTAQWQEWLGWVAIRGPVAGTEREDFRTSYLALRLGGPYGKKVRWSDFAMPWAPPDPDDNDDGEEVLSRG